MSISKITKKQTEVVERIVAKHDSMLLKDEVAVSETVTLEDGREYTFTVDRMARDLDLLRQY
jgi:hypothetical protein